MESSLFEKTSDVSRESCFSRHHYLVQRKGSCLRHIVAMANFASGFKLEVNALDT